MALFVKYIAALLSSFSLLFSTTGVSLLHHLCLHSGNHEVTLNYEGTGTDVCGDGMSCTEVDTPKDFSVPAFTMIDCCKEYADYAVVSVAYIFQQIQKISSVTYTNQNLIENNIQNLTENSENHILVKPPGIIKLPVLNIISFIIHSTDIGSELPA